MTYLNAVFRVVIFAGCAVLHGRSAEAERVVPPIEEGRYADDAAAQAAWKPMKGSARATASHGGDGAALRLPCNFAGTEFERASWDRAVQVDLAAARGVLGRLGGQAGG